MTQKSTRVGVEEWGKWEGDGYTCSAYNRFENLLVSPCESAWRVSALLPTYPCPFCSHMCVDTSPAPC